MAIKVKNAKKIVVPGTRYANDVRMAIEMEQGNPLTAGQDILLEQLAIGFATDQPDQDSLGVRKRRVNVRVDGHRMAQCDQIGQPQRRQGAVGAMPASRKRAEIAVGK